MKQIPLLLLLLTLVTACAGCQSFGRDTNVTADQWEPDVSSTDE